MRVAVVGAGAIGAYMGACLHRAGADVSLIARGDNLAALRAHGVRVLSPRGDFQVRPYATDDPAEIGAVDHVILGLKAYSYATCGPLVQPLLKEETSIVAAQNGIPWWYFHGLRGPHEDHRIEAVDPGGAVSRVLPPHRAIGCVVYAATELDAPGVVRHREGTRFSIGEPDGSGSQRCREFSDAMVAGGLKCPVEDDVRRDVWIKLMGNVAFNPISALTGATLAGMCRHEGVRELVTAMMRETLDIANALGCHPDIAIERRLAGAERTGEHKTSTLQDLERGKPLELAAMLTAVVELADLVGANAPTLRTINALGDLLGRRLAPREPAAAVPTPRE
ncbi:2-dehydropantoate 2-reductase [Saccharopolyspora rhizosphaerae]|uniref:2-dehydropantoate 2-reductase n=1 Tax=Saccharopolyspora rhizosphaerae TaxID=2492662 RepID=A0A3R8QVU8_9PSEU|nr:2-dehydropantoate 2-reductase [Saccharopolyspora rhizosphaerae]RRO20601.1 2-dehydropantoate 2-reductase [Saccharopolyspora rhizosphaerae]